MSNSFDNDLLNKWVDAIYEAALDDALWKPLIDQIGEYIGAQASQLFNLRFAPDDAAFWSELFSGVNSETRTKFENYFLEHDIWINNANESEFNKKEGIFIGEDLITTTNCRNTEILCDLIKLNVRKYDKSISLVVYNDKIPNLKTCTFLIFYK